MSGAPLVTPAELTTSPLLLLGPDGLPVAPLLVVDLTAPCPPAAVAAAAQSSRVLVGIAPRGVPLESTALAEQLTVTLVLGDASSAREVAVDDLEAEVRRLWASVQQAPRAAGVLVDLLRITARLPVQEGLVAESFAYSMLLGGPEFAHWRAARPKRHRNPEPGPLVVMRREGEILHVVLDRPMRHNAFSCQVRDDLVEALELALADPDLTVRLAGAGPSFCSGGDLDEFGTARDLAAAHLVRTGRSAGLLVHRLRERLEVELHGACIGAGLELPSFAGRVTAHSNVRLQLPELAMGLVPGAGGTVSITQRVGRWRTAYLALSGQTLDAVTAMNWGLIDAVLPGSADPSLGK